MSVNVAGFRWHATIFLSGSILLLAGFAAVAVLIFQTVYGAGRF
jgi:hypothetical protein